MTVENVLQDLGLDTFQVRLIRGTLASASADMATVHFTVNDKEHTGLLPHNEWYSTKPWRIGDTFTMAQLDDSARPQLSVTGDEIVHLVLGGLVPELRSGDVRIMGLARMPGVRAKVAVASTVEGLDAVSALVGTRANRVQAYKSTLAGERLDVVAWHPDKETYLRNAIGQKVTRVEFAEDGHAIVYVPEHTYQAALGGGAVNARLAHKLTHIGLSIATAS